MRASLTEINGAIEKARDDLDKRYRSMREFPKCNRNAQANLKITSLTTGGVEQADNIRTAMENLKQARTSVDERIVSLESEIAEASRKITSLSEINSVFGPDSSEELEEKKSSLLGKKEEAGRRILELESNIRATDIGSFKFVARAFDPEVARAEATENPILIKEAMDRAVNRVVKWFILILVIVFDPLAVTLVIAYNASLLRKKDEVGSLQELNWKSRPRPRSAFSVWPISLVFDCPRHGRFHLLPVFGYESFGSKFCWNSQGFSDGGIIRSANRRPGFCLRSRKGFWSMRLFRCANVGRGRFAQNRFR